MDSTARYLAARLRLARFVDHAVRLLLILGRTAFRAAVACRALVSGADHRSRSCRSDYADRAEEDGSRSDLVAF